MVRGQSCNNWFTIMNTTMIRYILGSNIVVLPFSQKLDSKYLQCSLWVKPSGQTKNGMILVLQYKHLKGGISFYSAHKALLLYQFINKVYKYCTQYLQLCSIWGIIVRILPVLLALSPAYLFFCLLSSSKYDWCVWRDLGNEFVIFWFCSYLI